MRQVIIKNKLGYKSKTVELYDGIKELPAWRYHELNKLFLQDAQIGSDMTTVSRHYLNLQQYILKDKKEEALKELQNLHNNLYYTIEGISIKSFCFMAMVHKIEGELITDFSMEAMKGYIDKLIKTGLKESHIADIVNTVKKNFFQSLEPTFLVGMERERLLTSILK